MPGNTDYKQQAMDPDPGSFTSNIDLMQIWSVEASSDRNKNQGA